MRWRDSKAVFDNSAEDRVSLVIVPIRPNGERSCSLNIVLSRKQQFLLILNYFLPLATAATFVIGLKVSTNSTPSTSNVLYISCMMFYFLYMFYLLYILSEYVKNIYVLNMLILSSRSVVFVHCT